MENVLELRKIRSFSTSFLEDWKRLGPMLKRRQELEGSPLAEHERELENLISRLSLRARRMQRLLNARAQIAKKLPMSWTWVQNYEVITNAILMVRGPRHERWEFWYAYPKITTLLEMCVGDMDHELEGWHGKAFNPLYWLRHFISIIARELFAGAFSLFRVSSVTVDTVMDSTLYKLVEVAATIGGALGFGYLIYLGMKSLGFIGMH